MSDAPGMTSPMKCYEVYALAAAPARQAHEWGAPTTYWAQTAPKEWKHCRQTKCTKCSFANYETLQVSTTLPLEILLKVPNTTQVAEAVFVHKCPRLKGYNWSVRSEGGLWYMLVPGVISAIDYCPACGQDLYSTQPRK